MDRSTNGPQQSDNVILEEVWYEGVDALAEGEGVCYNTNYGTAANFDGRRLNRVERASTVNNHAFAGVSLDNCSASSVGQFIRIAVPGSKGVKIALGADTTIDTGILTFQVGGGSAAGRFVKAGFRGRGSAAVRQTVTAVIEASMTGAWSLATNGLTLTVSDTTGLSAGDTVVLLAGANNGTSHIVPGKYVIGAVPAGGTTLTLASVASSVQSAGALTCTGYAYTGNPVCQADLLVGEESQGIEFVSPPNTGTSSSSDGFMVGGISYVGGGVTIASAVSNGALANAPWYCMKKGFIGLGTLTTNGVTVTMATAGFQLDGSTALAKFTIDAAADLAILQWNGVWVMIGNVAATQAAS